MDRSIKPFILKDLDDKIVFVTGPRQSGKTTLSQQLFSEYSYLNYDSVADRIILKEQSWSRKKPLTIFDELHKMPVWKGWLKGIYDTEKIPPRLLVTGSAKLDTYRRVGDSLAGRFFQYRLHPLDIKEACAVLGLSEEEACERLLTVSGFPEPFLKNDIDFFNRWQRSHLDIILRQDLIDLQAVQDIQKIETLTELLKRRVGTTISHANLARDLEKDPKTIKRWLQVLENLYVIFKVPPYSQKIARAIQKEPKYYFYNMAAIDSSEGAKLENLVACALLKEIHLLEDIKGIKGQLHFVRTREGKEIDFLVTINQKPILLIEVKSSDDSRTKHFDFFQKHLSCKKIQLVKTLKHEKEFPDGTEIRSLATYLKTLDLKVYL